MPGNYNLVDKIKNKFEFSKRKGITITGGPADEIIVHGASAVNKVVKEEKEKRAVFTFGRFNPPTTGHQKLINAVKSTAEKQGAEHHIFASHSQDKEKNPLGFDEKVGFMKKMFPKTNVHSSHTVRNVLDAARHLQARGVTHGTLVAGSDRVDEIHNLLSKYNKHPSDPDYDPKKHFYIPHLNVISAGQRDPDAEGVEGMSASKMRSHAASGNFKEFTKGVSNPGQAKSMYDTLRSRMGIKEEFALEQLIRSKIKVSDTGPAIQSRRLDHFDSTAQQTLDNKKNATKMASGREDAEGLRISKKPTYNPKPTQGLHADLTSHPYEETIPTPFQRGKTDSVDIGTDKDLESQDINNQLKRRKSMKLFSAYVEGIDGDGIAGSEKPGTPAPVTTALPSVRLPKQRIKTMNSTPVSEEADDYMKLEGGLWANIHAKRKRIKAGSGERMRKPGEKGAPSAAGIKSAQEEFDYQIDEKSDTGLAAKARVRHWTKMSKYSDKDFRAYEPAPGDADAKTKESKHTKKYHQMYGEDSHTRCGTPECCGGCDKGYIEERGADSKGYFRSTEGGAGLTKKGVSHFRAANPGSKLQTAVTGKVKPGSKDANRRKSFCARMGGMPGPMEDEKGRPTRKAMSLRRWRC